MPAKNGGQLWVWAGPSSLRFPTARKKKIIWAGAPWYVDPREKKIEILVVGKHEKEGTK